MRLDVVTDGAIAAEQSSETSGMENKASPRILADSSSHIFFISFNAVALSSLSTILMA